jgi:hypothetical protein
MSRRRVPVEFELLVRGHRTGGVPFDVENRERSFRLSPPS